MSYPQESAQKKQKKGDSEPREATHTGKTAFESAIMLDFQKVRKQFGEKSQSALPEALLFRVLLLEAEDNRLLILVFTGDRQL